MTVSVMNTHLGRSRQRYVRISLLLPLKAYQKGYRNKGTRMQAKQRAKGGILAYIRVEPCYTVQAAAYQVCHRLCTHTFAGILLP